MRTSPLALGGIALVLAGPLACEPPAPVVPTPAPSATTAVVAAAPAAPTYDLAPVAEPADVVGVLRWKSAQQSFGTLGSCSGVPSALTEQLPRTALAKAFRKWFGEKVDTNGLASAVALDAPLDVIVALDQAARTPKPVVAAAIGLTSLDAAKHAAEGAGPLNEVVPGMWRVGEKDRGRMICMIAVSGGSTPARLVCGEKEKDITALAPYLTRTLPTTAPAASDLHVEARIAPMDTRFGSELRQQLRGLPMLAQTQASIGEPEFDHAVVEAATALTEEVGAIVGDLDKVTLDSSIDKTNCLTVGASLQMRGKASWLTNTLIDRPDRAGPPPAIFWRAPRDADSAAFGRGGDPARYTDILRTLRTMVVSGLRRAGVGSEDDRKALADLLSLPLSKDANVVQASGRPEAPSANDKAAAKPGAKPAAKPAVKGDSELKRTIESIVGGASGWSVIGYDEGGDAVAKQLKDLVAVYNRKGLFDKVKGLLGKDSSYLPAVKLVAAPAQLGKGALDVEVKFDFAVDEPPSAVFAPAAENDKRKPSKPAPKPVAVKKEHIAFSFHILLMPDAKSTWLAFGVNRDELVKHLLMSKSGAPESDTIASRPGLEPLKNGKNMSGGFFTLTMFTKSLTSALSGKDLSDTERGKIMAALAAMPHKGETPLFFTTQLAGGNAPHADLQLQIPRGTLEDVGSLANTILREVEAQKAGN